MSVEPEIRLLGELDGQAVYFAHYETADIRITFCNVGASIVSLKTKDANGEWADIVLGYDDWHDYANNLDNYMGSVVGRCANRIRNGQFSLNGKQYQLAINNGRNHLHGGVSPFTTKVWKADFTQDRAMFTLCSPDGEEQYPGNVTVMVTYLIHDCTIQIRYEGVSDQDTLLNVTNHTYFNLDGHEYGSLDHHLLQIDANCYLPIDETLIPTGELCHVEHTPFDFREMKPILQDIDQDDVQLKRGYGYDHTFVCEGNTVLASHRSKRFVRVRSNMPGIQIYTGNYMNCQGKNKAKYGFRSGVALETQYFPDSINQPNFSTCMLRANETYLHEAVFEFGIME